MTTLGVAVVGFGWMGRVHTQAYGRLAHHYPDLPPIELVAVADDVPGRAAQAAAQFGFVTAVDDWQAIADDPRVEAVSITAPNFLHREIGVAMARAGKHIWIEKPVGLSAADATAVRDAAAAAGKQSTVGFNYRHAPAVQAAREFVQSGEIGEVTHVRFRFFSDYAAHPDGALTWRFQMERGGHGILGDLGSHGIDMARFVVGEIDALVADTAIFIPERPKPSAATSGHTRASGGELGPVENEDYMSCLVRFANGGRGVIDVSRVSVGAQNSYAFEVHGTRGAVFWDFRRMGELAISRGAEYQDQPVTTIFVGPGVGDYGSFQPGSATSMSYDDLKVIEARNFVRSIADGVPLGATLDDAVASATALDAVVRSVESGAWVTL